MPQPEVDCMNGAVYCIVMYITIQYTAPYSLPLASAHVICDSDSVLVKVETQCAQEQHQLHKCQA
jgi:hypothetical protein